ncbi:MAG: N-acetyltransferase [Marinosulfonomonas sp.]|nr:N-acetyltransferase [Marinosulfonomonas sp.]
MPTNIHETSIISPKAELGEDVVVGPYTIIGDKVRIGNNTHIEAYCEIGIAQGTQDGGLLTIGAHSTIRSGTVLYQGSTFGEGFTTGHKVTVREGVTAGDGLQLGTLSDIQGRCQFGEYVKLHSNVHVGQASILGDYIWIFPYVVLTNDPHPPSETRLGCHLEDFCVVATMSTVLPGVRLGRGALIGAMTLVREDVPDDNICVGVPGRLVGETKKIKFKKTGEPVYPWRRHFHRGYPDEIVKSWIAEFE